MVEGEARRKARGGVDGNLCGWELGGHGVSETTQTAVPRLHVEAAADLGQHVLERVGDHLEVALLQVDLLPKLLGEELELFMEDGWGVEEVDDGVEPVRHSHHIGAERGARFVFYVKVGHELLGARVSVQQMVDDCLHDADLAVGVGRMPDLVPHEGHLFLILRRATVVRLLRVHGAGRHGGD